MLDSILAKIGIAISGALITLAGFFSPITTPPADSLGSTIPNATALFQTSLASPISSSDTSMTLVSGTDKSGATLSGYTCFTIDSGQTNQEFVCGTASSTSVTSMVRGINPTSGTTTVAALQFSHRRGADVKITDYPVLGIIRNIVNGSDTFPNAVTYGSGVSISTLQGNTKNLASVEYVNTVATSGAPFASDVLAGVAKVSVTPASSTNPIAVGDNDGRVPTQAENDALAGTSGSPSSTNKYVTNDDTATTTSASKVVRAKTDGLIDSSYVDLSSIITGNGNDGASTTSAGTWTLTRDYYFTNLTVATGTTVNTNGYRIFATGTISISGTITENGGNGGNASLGTGGTAGAAAHATGTIPASFAGTAGGNGGGTGGADGGGISAQSFIASIGVNGAKGGNGGNDTSGTHGTSTSATSTAVAVRYPYSAVEAVSLLSGTTTSNGVLYMLSSPGGNGGGGGASQGGATAVGGGGGGGGASGGFIALYAKSIVVNAGGTIEANGGNGGNGANGSGAGASAGGGGSGAGGSGGVILLVYNSYTNNGSVTVNGGTAGATAGSGANGGGNGTVGSNGLSGVIYRIKF